MQDTTLSGARFRDSVWTSAFDAIWAVAISSNGSYCAAGSRRGEVRIWRIGSNGQKEVRFWHEGGYTLHLTWQAHTDAVDRTLAFSPDERLLATGIWDGTIKLWEVESGALLWTGWHANLVEGLAFAPDGQRLVSCGDDGALMIWDLESGEHLRTLRRDRPYERLNITGIRGLTQAEIATLRALGAVEDEADEQSSCPDQADQL
jgi:WD40 repeat protein